MNRVAMRFPEDLVGLRKLRSAPAASAAANGGAPVSDPVRERLQQQRQLEQQAGMAHEARAQLARAVAASLQGVEACVTRELETARDWILELALSLASDVLHAEIDAGRYDVAQAIEASLRATLRDGADLRLQVATEDEAELRALLAQIASEDAVDASRVVVEVQAGRARGSCAAITKAGGFRSDPAGALAHASARIREAFA